MFSFNRNKQIAILALTGLLIAGSAISAVDYFLPSAIDNFEVWKAVVPVPPVLSHHAGVDSTRVPTLLNLNQATEKQLQRQPQIGPKTAALVVSHREINGPFESVDQQANVKGIGPRTLEKLRNRVTIATP